MGMLHLLPGLILLILSGASCLLSGASCFWQERYSCSANCIGEEGSGLDMQAVLAAFDSLLRPFRQAAEAARTRRTSTADAAQQSLEAVVDDMAMTIGAQDCRSKKKRKSYLLDSKSELGERAVSARRQYIASHGDARGWIMAFVTEHYGLVRENPEFRAKYHEVRQAHTHANKTAGEPAAMAVTRGGTRNSHRKRRYGGGRRTEAMCLFEELWHWFCDRLHNVRGRITSQMILHQTEVIKTDIRHRHLNQVER